MKSFGRVAIAMDELIAFLAANHFSKAGWSSRVEEGAVTEVKPDLLILGMHGRSGLLKALFGSVTEEVLRSLNVDILAVPPVRR